VAANALKFEREIDLARGEGDPEESLPACVAALLRSCPRVQDQLDGVPIELLVWNGGEYGHGFAICLRCGYADAEDRPGGTLRVDLPSEFARHLPVHKEKGGWCWRENEAPVLRHEILAARQRTDLLVLDFDGTATGPLDREVALTLGHALKQCGARWLEVDGRELGVLILPSAFGGCRTVLYDDTPGGSGHVLELAEGLLATGSRQRALSWSAGMPRSTIRHASVRASRACSRSRPSRMRRSSTAGAGSAR
jgi:hypothetical protein